MCLDSINKIHSPPVIVPENTIGYKAYLKYHDGGINPTDQGIDKFTFEVGKWYKCHNPDYQIVMDDYGVQESYPAGFHIFKTEEVAANWAKDSRSSLRSPVVGMVEYQDVVCQGEQAGYDVIIAQKIKILSLEDLS